MFCSIGNLANITVIQQKQLCLRIIMLKSRPDIIFPITGYISLVKQDISMWVFSWLLPVSYNSNTPILTFILGPLSACHAAGKKCKELNGISCSGGSWTDRVITFFVTLKYYRLWQTEKLYFLEKRNLAVFILTKPWAIRSFTNFI